MKMINPKYWFLFFSLDILALTIVMFAIAYIQRDISLFVLSMLEAFISYKVYKIFRKLNHENS